MTDRLSAEYLLKHFKDGWWPYVPGGGPSLEATAWCALACRQHTASVRRTIEQLLASQHADGGWCNVPDLPESDWSTGIAVLALNILESTLSQKGAGVGAQLRQSVERGTRFLSTYRSDFITDVTRIGMMLVQGPEFDYPRGWPWAPKTFNWVEPSAYAILAIKTGPLAQEKHYQNVLKEAHSYLLEKCCAEGGWNFGSPTTFGVDWPPLPSPTSLALLALQDQPGPAVTRAVERLRSFNGPPIDSTIAESLSIIARNLHQDDVSKLIIDLHSNYKRRENPGETLVGIAAGTIATTISREGNPFKLKTAS